MLQHPERLYRTLALAEVITWTLLLLGMLGKYVLDLGQLGVRIGGGLHGFVFLAYCLVTLMVAVDQRWPVLDVLLGLGSAVVPYATVPFERYAERAGLLAPQWRLHAEAPGNPAERIVTRAVQRPLAALAVGLAAVALLFCGLLLAGPPTQWVG